MDDEWDDSPTMVAPVPLPPVTPDYNTADVDGGHSLSRGRGFSPFTDDGDNTFGSGESNGYGDRRGRGGRGGRGGDRRGRGARGGRGGRGGRDGGSGDDYKDYMNGGGDNDDGDGDRGDRNERGRGRGRGWGRGGRGGGRGGDGDSPEDDENAAPTPAPVTYVPPEPSQDEGEIFGSTITSGINFDKYDHIAVKVTGDNPPKAISSFETAGLRKYVLENIIKSGYKKPTPIQKQAMPIIMDGRDLMGCAQTGSGKTAAFLLPIINSLLQDPRELVVSENGCAQPQVVIVSPTRELTIQIFNEARKFAHGSILKIAVAYGGTAVRHQGDKLTNGCHILVATPGRLHDFVNRHRLSFESIRFVVLDEADRMLDMGFMPDVEKMMEHSTMVPKTERQTLMFSATFPEDIQHLAGRFLNNYLFVAVGIVGGACSDVEQIFMEVSGREKRDELHRFVKDNPDKRMLVFVETKRNADYLGAWLSESGHPTTTMHGDRAQSEREEALANFKRGKQNILIATAVAARGLDIKNVDIVVNYDLPKSIDEYVHRIGRTGRVGNRGKAVSFFDSNKDVAVAGDLAKILRQAEQPVPDFLQDSGFASYTTSKYGGSDIRSFDNAGAGEQGDEPGEEW